MKKIFIAALGTLAVLACTKNDVVYSDNGQEIGFTPVPANITKGTGALTGATGYPEDGIFSVFSYRVTENAGTEWANTLTSEKWFENIEFVRKDGTLWHGNPSQYWPKTGSLFFGGIHPYSATGYSYDFAKASAKVEGFTTGTYSSVKANSNMVDLMYFDVNERASARENNVGVLFHHALSWITINVSSTMADVYQLNSIAVEKVNTKGDFSSNPAAWANHSVPQDYIASTDYTPAYLSTAATTFDDLLLVPQDLTDGNNLVIKFQQKNGMGSLSAEQEVKFALKSYTSDSKWKPGTHYIYNITFNVDEILLVPYIEDWTEESINLPEIQ